MNHTMSDAWNYIDVLACKKSLTVLRSLSDGLWAEPREIAKATPLTLPLVEQSLEQLVACGFVEQREGLYREVTENILPVVHSLAAA